MSMITALALGSGSFKSDYNLKYAYLAGAMYKGIASPELVIRLGRSGFMGYLGTGGLSLMRIETAIQQIQQQLQPHQPYGMNLLCNLIKPELEEDTVDLFFKYQIPNVEAAAYMQITPSLVRYRLKGLHRNPRGEIVIPHRILAKVSRPEVAQAFMRPAPAELVHSLVQAGKLNSEEAELSQFIPMSYDICVESDSGGHTDQGVAYVLMPAMLKLRDEIMASQRYPQAIRVGAAGGIGTHEAAAAIVLTQRFNQWSHATANSDIKKDLSVMEL